MKKEILEHLSELERDRNIEILMAVESGSRAWGCPSPDSDYDVRIVFKRPTLEYLEIENKSDNIDYFHGALLDINGWDIKKVLKLIRKSNVTPFEWAQSPIVYREKEGFTTKILEYCRTYFQARHSLNHYRGLAYNSYIKGMQGDLINLKKLFYVLRPLLAAKWIIDKKEVPPMDILSLLVSIPDPSIVHHIEELLKMKTGLNEDYLHEMKPEFKDFLDDLQADVKEAEIEDQPTKMNVSSLNAFFQATIGI